MLGARLSWSSVADMCRIALRGDFLQNKKSHLKGMFFLPLWVA